MAQFNQTCSTYTAYNKAFSPIIKYNPRMVLLWLNAGLPFAIAGPALKCPLLSQLASSSPDDAGGSKGVFNVRWNLTPGMIWKVSTLTSPSTVGMRHNATHNTLPVAQTNARLAYL